MNTNNLYRKIQNAWCVFLSNRIGHPSTENQTRYTQYTTFTPPTEINKLRMKTIKFEKGWIFTEGYKEVMDDLDIPLQVIPSN